MNSNLAVLWGMSPRGQCLCDTSNCYSPAKEIKTGCPISDTSHSWLPEGILWERGEQTKGEKDDKLTGRRIKTSFFLNLQISQMILLNEHFSCVHFRHRWQKPASRQAGNFVFLWAWQDLWAANLFYFKKAAIF